MQIQSQLQAVNKAMVMMQKGLAGWRLGPQEPALVCLLGVTLQLLQLLLARLPGLLCQHQLSEPLVSEAGDQINGHVECGRGSHGCAASAD